MIENAEKKGLLKPNSIIVEATSGNTAVSLAMVAAAKGYRLLLVMPDDAPPERRRLLARLGTEEILTPSYLGMQGTKRMLQNLLESNANMLCLEMFHNQAVVEVHKQTTAKEILDATSGDVDAFVAGVGTAGTITGVGSILKAKNPKLLLVAVEPASSSVLSQEKAGRHMIPGIGPDFVPPLLDRSIVDEVIAASDQDAQNTSLRLMREEGILAGISSGANVFASCQVAKRLGQGKRVVTMVPDGAERNISYPM
jgi:cysteine synthase A